MHVKFLARGSGSAGAAAEYLLEEENAAGEEREEVEVLRGDPWQVAEVADSLEFEHRYTSGVIAWAPEDEPSEDEIEKTLDEFESTAWAGLDEERYAWSAVLHRETDGGVHVHVLAARCDLETGKSLNIAPPGWQKAFDALRDSLNYEHGWSRPDDPQRARVVQPGHRAGVEATRLRAGLAVEPEPRELIRDYLVERIESGAIQDRDGVVGALREAGLEVPRQGKHYVTARDPESGSRWRLKGAIYEADFQRSRFVDPAAGETGAGAAGDRERDRQRAAQARRELEAHRERRAAYHRSRYGGSDRAAARDAAVGLAEAAGDRGSALDRHLRGELGSDEVVGVADPEPDRDQGLPGAGDRAAAGDRGAVAAEHVGNPAAGDSQGAVRGAAAGDAGPSALESGREACREALEKVRELYDRVGTAVDEGLARVVGAVRAGTEAAGRAGRGLAAAGRAAREAGAAVGPGLQAARRDLAHSLEVMRRAGAERGRERGRGFDLGR
ncbi:MAG: relaxase/mobilization nuclease domain-containing protein [Acidobacteriota bacterium]|nr:relaxase/mobilization nuclease domain-containing protein [Acidobacteriota bacterium]